MGARGEAAVCVRTVDRREPRLTADGVMVPYVSSIQSSQPPHTASRTTIQIVT